MLYIEDLLECVYIKQQVSASAPNDVSFKRKLLNQRKCISHSIKERVENRKEKKNT